MNPLSLNYPLTKLSYLEGEEVAITPVHLKSLAVIPCHVDHEHLLQIRRPKQKHMKSKPKYITNTMQWLLNMDGGDYTRNLILKPG